MARYILRRILASIPLLLGISLVSFIIIQLPPGDFATAYERTLVSQAGMTEAEAEEVADRARVRYGLDKPVYIQYFNWIKGMVTEGSFGFSFAYKKDVGELIAERLPRTLMIALLAHLVSTAVGIVAGIYSATHQYGLADTIGTFFAFIATALPRFFLAVVLLYWLAFGLRVEHTNAFYSPQYALAPWSWGKVVDLLKHIWPVVAIAGLGGVARNMRVMRGNLLDVLNAQYVTTARSKGLTENQTIYRHAVPNALHPIVMYQGTVLPYMLAGELEAAIIFGLPTLAPLFLASLYNQDIYVTGSLLLVYGVLLVAGNLLADVLLSVLDPRIRYD